MKYFPNLTDEDALATVLAESGPLLAIMDASRSF